MSYTYLAIAYTGQEEESYQYSLDALATYMRNEVPAFSPIVHGHTVAAKHELPTEWPFWKQHALAMVTGARAIHVIVPPEWESKTLESRGVIAEVRYALSLGKHMHAVALDGDQSRIHVDETTILNGLTEGGYAQSTGQPKH